MMTYDWPIKADDKAHSDAFEGYRTLLPFFHDAPMSEVLSRITYQVILREYRANPLPFRKDASTGLYFLALKYDRIGMRWISNWLSVFAAEVRKGKKSRIVLQEICARARYYQEQARRGRPWRQAPRNPRVTNRGVAVGSAHEERQATLFKDKEVR